MKKLLLIALISFIGIKTSNAQIEVSQAKSMINKTNEYVFIARKEMRTHHVFSGDLSRVVHYQQSAIQKFKKRKYTTAYFLSFTARYFANKSINANTGNHRLFIQILSDIDKKIVINDTTAEISDPWPGKNASLSKRNNFFVKVATENVNKRDIDHIGNFGNHDEELENGDLEIENL